MPRCEYLAFTTVLVYFVFRNVIDQIILPNLICYGIRKKKMFAAVF